MSDPFRDIEKQTQAEPVVGGSPVAYWLREIDLSMKREKRWRKDACRVVELYEVAKQEENSFNILYANTETLLPSCYNQLPRPFVDRRFKDEDPLGKVSAKALERVLSSLEDTGNAEYAQFHDLMQMAVLAALLPGRGVTWWRYDASFTKESPAEERAEGEASGGARETGQLLVEPTEKVKYETVCGEDISYDELLLGYATTWEKVPWIARCHEMSKDDIKDNFGAKYTELVKYTKPAQRDQDGVREVDDSQEKNRGAEPVALVYEIWIKSKRQVVFLSPDYKEAFLKEVDDPYGLSGFFPVARPLQFLLKKTSLVPTPIYRAYEPQAKELNRVSQRINRIIHALKVRGFYDGSIQGLRDLLQSDDNTLKEAKNVGALKEYKSLGDAIWLMPLNELITVLQQLYIQREQCKNVIYEITGISDIMRGDTQASETYGAQKLKSQWGTLRLQKMQARVQAYVRDCLRVMAELASEHFSVETFAGMTDLDYAMPKQVEEAQKMVQAIQQQMLRMPPTPPAEPGQPPGPPQMPPQMQQAEQQAQAVLAKPRWADIMGLLRDDVLRNYRVDIETNSTIDPNTTEDKQNLSDVLNSLASIFQSFLPAVQAGALTMPALKSIIMTVVRRFQFGREVEDAVEQMPEQLPQQQDPNAPTQDEIAARNAKAQLDQQTSQQKLAQSRLEMQNDEQKAQMEQRRMQLEAAQKEREAQMQEREFQLKMLEMQQKMAMTQMETSLLGQKQAAEERALAVEEQSRIQQAQAGSQKAVLEVQKTREGMEVDRANAQRQSLADEDAKVESQHKRTKLKREDQVHAAETNARIRKANTPEPMSKDQAHAIAAKAVEELLAHVRKPVKATKNHDGSFNFQR